MLSKKKFAILILSGFFAPIAFVGIFLGGHSVQKKPILGELVTPLDTDDATGKPNIIDSARPEENVVEITGRVYPVIKVIDGDTITIAIDGKNETLRLIGINTPETVDPRTTVECFGKEASAKAYEFLDGRSVRIEQDASQGERDKYG